MPWPVRSVNFLVKVFGRPEFVAGSSVVAIGFLNCRIYLTVDCFLGGGFLGLVLIEYGRAVLVAYIGTLAV